jgi:integrase
MAIRKRGQRYVADVRDRTGTRYRPSFRSRSEALEWEDDAKRRTRQGKPLDLPDRGTSIGTRTEDRSLLAGVNRTYVDVWTHNKDGDGSLVRGRQAAEMLGPDRHVATLAPRDFFDLHKVMKKAGKTHATINRHCAAMSRVLTHAVDLGWIASRFRVPQLPEDLNRVRYLDLDEERAALEWCVEHQETMFASLIIVLVDTGMRMGEARSLEWSDIDLKRGSIRLDETKSGYPRTIPLTDRASRALAGLKTGPPGSMGGPFIIEAAETAVNRKWNRMRDTLGMNEDKAFTPHVLRHTFCSRLSQAGVDLNRIKELAGHRSVKTTLRYAHLNEESLRDSIDVLQSVTAK